SPLQRDAANRGILLLQQLPGVGQVKASLTPGQTTGSTRIQADVEPGPWVDGFLAMDNFGNSYTGEYRLSGLLHINSPLGIGDRLTVAGSVSESGHLAYGHVGWDAPT